MFKKDYWDKVLGGLLIIILLYALLTILRSLLVIMFKTNMLGEILSFYTSMYTWISTSGAAFTYKLIRDIRLERRKNNINRDYTIRFIVNKMDCIIKNNAIDSDNREDFYSQVVRKAVDLNDKKIYDKTIEFYDLMMKVQVDKENLKSIKKELKVLL